MLRKSVLPIAVSFACLSLAACGGGGGGGGLSGADATIQSQVKAPASALGASTIDLQGLATSVNGAITSASWQQINGPAATLTNPTCSAANSVPQGGTSGANAVLNYACTTGLILPNVQQATNFAFQFTATNTAGGTTTSQVNIPVAPAVHTPLTVIAGPSQSLFPGQTYTGSCAAISNAAATINASGGATQSPAIDYQWQLQPIIGDGGTPVLNLGPNGSVSFAAPVASAQTTYTLVCRATDSLGNTGSATVNVTNYGTAALPPMVVSAGNAQVSAVNTQVVLQASATTNPPSATPVYYYWEQTSGPSVKLSNAATASPSFVYSYTPPAKSASAPASGSSAPASGSSAPASGSSAPASSSSNSNTTSALATLTFTVYASYQPITASNLSSVPLSQQASTSVVITTTTN